MTHLSEEQLNLYLDGALLPQEQSAVEAHLAGCATCQADLDSLQTLFVALDALQSDLLTADLNHDGQTDLVIGGNFYPAVPYMGRYDASYGWLVNVLPGPTFSVEWPAKSGFLVRGEIRDMKFFRTGKEREIVIGLNDQEPEVFSVR